jgi:hypothetical protein
VKQIILGRVVSYSFATVCMLCIGYRLLYLAIQPVRVVYWFDHGLNYPIRLSLQHIVSPLIIKQKNFNDIQQICIDRWPAVQSISVRLLSSQTSYVMVQGIKPLVVMNNNFVISNEGKILSVSEFHEDVIASLPRIVVEDVRVMRNENTRDLLDFITSMPPDLLKTAIIRWLHKTRIYIEDPAFPSLKLIAWYKTRFTEKLRNDVGTLQTILELKNKEIKRKDIQWQADIRLEGQIVLVRV